MSTSTPAGDLALQAQDLIMKITADNFIHIRQMDEGDFNYFVNNLANLLSAVTAVAEEAIKVAECRAQMRETIIWRLRRLTGAEVK